MKKTIRAWVYTEYLEEVILELKSKEAREAHRAVEWETRAYVCKALRRKSSSFNKVKEGKVGPIFEKKMKVETCDWRDRKEPYDTHFLVDHGKEVWIFILMHWAAIGKFWTIDLAEFIFLGGG